MDDFSPRDLEAAADRLDEALGGVRLDAAVVAGSGVTVSPAGWAPSGTVGLDGILPFPLQALPGHTLSVTLWRRGDRSLLAFNGRLHLYQGYSAPQVAAAARLAALLGARAYIATNAAGGMDEDLHPGELVVIRDHINLQGVNALAGVWSRWREPMFPDMSKAYDPTLRRAAVRLAIEAGFSCREGIYVGVLGPSFETPAEVAMLHTLGGNVVGMSTVQEVIAAHHLGMKVLVLSLVTNAAAGRTAHPLSHEEVLVVGEASRERLQVLLGRLLEEVAPCE